MKNNIISRKINNEKYELRNLDVGEISIAQNFIENNKKTLNKGNLVSAQAITLISLVITIILLIILTGVTINLSLGENGIFNKVKQAKEQYSESIAREKLEMVLLDVVAEKETNTEYNNEQFLDDMLKKNGIEIDGDNVIVDNYTFTIDRESLGISQSLGQTQIKVSKEVQSYLGKNANDKYEAQLLIIVESNTNLQKVEIINPDGTTFEIETDQEKMAKDLTVEFDEEYKLEITDKTGKKETRTIVERTEEGIRTAEEIAEFRDKVNTGLTYEGKIINLLKDIDLSTVCGEDVNGEEISWEPIGIGNDDINLYREFKGQFKGNYHTIDNLYINNSKDYQALFGIIDNAIIKELIIGENSNIIANNEVASIVAKATDSTIQNCGNNANVQGKEIIGGICGYAVKNCNFKYCYNKGNIIAIKGQGVAGITSWMDDNSTICNCYNIGNITLQQSKTTKAYVAGIAGSISDKCTLKNNYNLGTINNNSSSVWTGGIVGATWLSASDGSISNIISRCYNNGNVYSNGFQTGGICGENSVYSYVEDCYISNSIEVKYKDTLVTNQIGKSNQYLGRIGGYIRDSKYLNNVGELSQMPTVYEVVNGNEEIQLNNGDSEVWSNTEYTDENLKTPKFKREI